GSSPQTSSTPDEKIPPSANASQPSPSPIRPMTCGPRTSAINPAMIDTGKKSFCAVRLRTRIMMPTKASTPSSKMASPTVDGDICTPFEEAYLSQRCYLYEVYQVFAELGNHSAPEARQK